MLFTHSIGSFTFWFLQTKKLLLEIWSKGDSNFSRWMYKRQRALVYINMVNGICNAPQFFKKDQSMNPAGQCDFQLHQSFVCGSMQAWSPRMLIQFHLGLKIEWSWMKYHLCLWWCRIVAFSQACKRCPLTDWSSVLILVRTLVLTSHYTVLQCPS